MLSVVSYVCYVCYVVAGVSARRWTQYIPMAVRCQPGAIPRRGPGAIPTQLPGQSWGATGAILGRGWRGQFILGAIPTEIVGIDRGYLSNLRRILKNSRGMVREECFVADGPGNGEIVERWLTVAPFPHSTHQIPRLSSRIYVFHKK